MTDWIDEEVERIRQTADDKRRQAELEKALDGHGRNLYEDVKWAVEKAIEKINATPEIMKKLGDPLQYTGIYTSHFEVKKRTFPSVQLTVTSQGRELKVERIIYPDVRSSKGKQEREYLRAELDNDGKPFLRSEGGEVLGVHDAAGYLLRPLLNY